MRAGLFGLPDALQAPEVLRQPHAAPHFVSATRRETNEHFYSEIENPGAL